MYKVNFRKIGKFTLVEILRGLANSIEQTSEELMWTVDITIEVDHDENRE